MSANCLRIWIDEHRNICGTTGVVLMREMWKGLLECFGVWLGERGCGCSSCLSVSKDLMVFCMAINFIVIVVTLLLLFLLMICYCYFEKQKKGPD